MFLVRDLHSEKSFAEIQNWACGGRIVCSIGSIEGNDITTTLGADEMAFGMRNFTVEGRIGYTDGKTDTIVQIIRDYTLSSAKSEFFCRYMCLDNVNSITVDIIFDIEDE